MQGLNLNVCYRMMCLVSKPKSSTFCWKGAKNVKRLIKIKFWMTLKVDLKTSLNLNKNQFEQENRKFFLKKGSTTALDKTIPTIYWISLWHWHWICTYNDVVVVDIVVVLNFIPRGSGKRVTSQVDSITVFAKLLRVTYVTDLKNILLKGNSKNFLRLLNDIF